MVSTVTKSRKIERKDAWTSEMDQQLLDIVLNAIRQGKTQTQGFVAASEVIGKSKSACAFRFNTEIRKKHGKQLEKAKSVIGKDSSNSEERVSKRYAKSSSKKTEPITSETAETSIKNATSGMDTPSLDAVIKLLQSMKANNDSVEDTSIKTVIGKIETVIVESLVQLDTIKGRLSEALEQIRV